MTTLDYRTTTPLNNFRSVKHTLCICTGIGDKIQISRIFSTGITFSRGVAEITVTVDISEIPAEKKIPGHRYNTVAPRGMPSQIVG
jgi:hypothetical protein